MNDKERLYEPQNDSEFDERREIATEIERRYQLLRQEFDGDLAHLRSYLERVAQFDARPRSQLPRTKEEFDDENLAFEELIDAYPLAPAILKDQDAVYRRSMARLCSELLKAEVALKAEKKEKSWSHLSRASFYEGQAQGYCLAVKSSQAKKRSGEKGGMTKEANKLEAARKACIDRLNNDQPQSGWGSPDVAVRAVASKVADMLRKERGEYVDVHKLLHEWLNGDQEVQQAGGFRMQCTD